MTIQIIFDWAEDKTLIRHLTELCKKEDIELIRKQHKRPGDYIITTEKGSILLIERKSLIDLWGSLTTKEKYEGMARPIPKLYRQISDIVQEADRLGRDRAHPYLLVEWVDYFPRQATTKVPEYMIRKTALTAASTSSKFVRILVSANKQHSAELLVKLAKEFDERTIYG